MFDYQKSLYICKSGELSLNEHKQQWKFSGKVAYFNDKREGKIKHKYMSINGDTAAADNDDVTGPMKPLEDEKLWKKG